ncbi:hypothetical protein ICM05_01430 [Leucobacter sp. cx-42]|uniref:M12 family metallo-peptidase n=1 Tax=unclassified Leucobacter TaxID=2621730 RepID=UPI00165EA146|nr:MULTISPECIES: zinc-dependent metalloprotease family protein [unclassified Leucobacter]MBC9953309.1 hypothetical protein [Leucobacter sp. cx-42]
MGICALTVSGAVLPASAAEEQDAPAPVEQSTESGNSPAGNGSDTAGAPATESTPDVPLTDEARHTETPQDGINEESTSPKQQPSTPARTPRANSTQAIEPDKFVLAANNSGKSADELRQLEAAGTIYVSANGSIRFTDQRAHHFGQEISGLRSAEPDSEMADESTSGTNPLSVNPGGAEIPGNPEDGSRPDAPVTIYLDFDGETLVDTAWNYDEEVESLDFAPASAATGNPDFVHEVWALVAEDYAPFDVNVTTTRPSDANLYKTSLDDNSFGSHAIITDSYTDVLPSADGAVGLAQLYGAGSRFETGAFTFTSPMSSNDPAQVDPKNVAETISHEVGHNFGLEHDGYADEEYYTPTSGVWGPIMGAPDFVPLGHWSMGEYANSTNDENDLLVITDRDEDAEYFTLARLPNGTRYTGTMCPAGDADPDDPKRGDVFYVADTIEGCNVPGEPLTLEWDFRGRADATPDTVGNTLEDAATFDLSAGEASTANVITSAEDVDVYTFETSGGYVSASVAAAAIAPNLFSSLRVIDAGGNIVADSANELAWDGDVLTGMNATVNTFLHSGTYFLEVSGAGWDDPSTVTSDEANAFTDYGSIGNYNLTADLREFAVHDISITSPSNGSKIPQGDLVVTGLAIANADVEVIAGDKTVARVEADAAGAWSATIRADDLGELTIEARQAVDGQPIDGTATVTVTVEGTGGPTKQRLANTGAETGPAPYGALAAVLIALGSAITIAASRRRTA